MNDILPAADFIGFARSITPDSTSIEVFLGTLVIMILAFAGTICGVRFWRLDMEFRSDVDSHPWRTASATFVSALVLVFSALWMINVGALTNAHHDAEEAAKTAKAEGHVKAFAYHAIGETIGAESDIYAAGGTYTEAFPDLVGADPGLNRFLVDDLVPKKQLELGAGGKSVMIEYTFRGASLNDGGQTLNVYLDEGSVTVSGCHAASWMGCKDGSWDPRAASFYSRR